MTVTRFKVLYELIKPISAVVRSNKNGSKREFSQNQKGKKQKLSLLDTSESSFCCYI